MDLGVKIWVMAEKIKVSVQSNISLEKLYPVGPLIAVRIGVGIGLSWSMDNLKMHQLLIFLCEIHRFIDFCFLPKEAENHLRK
jgi:hypothetical protein